MVVFIFSSRSSNRLQLSSGSLLSCAGALPQAQPLILHAKPLIVFWESLWGLTDDRQGLKLGLKLELCRLTNTD